MKRKNDKGFTLFENIISIAVLSFISIFILQMFISAQSLNTRAKDADTAISKAITALDGFKAPRSLDDYLAKCGGVISEGVVSDGTNIATVLFYYDQNWSLSGTEVNAHYRLKMDISSDDEIMLTNISDVAHGRLYTVAVEVTESTLDGNVRTLASLRSKKYFSAKSAIVGM